MENACQQFPILGFALVATDPKNSTNICTVGTVLSARFKIKSNNSTFCETSRLMEKRFKSNVRPFGSTPRLKGLVETE